LLVCLVLLSATAALVLNSTVWRILTLMGAVFSQFLIVIWWKDAQFGTAANILLAGIVVLQMVSRSSSHPIR
jgi:hypothetical protein